MRNAVVCVVAAIAMPMYPSTSRASAPEIYDQLRSLVGDGEADLPGFGKMTSTVRLVCNGKAIEEVIGTPTDNELSVYTLNAGRILLTHYCAMTPDGHQVRLQTPPLGAKRERLDFSFVSATNLHSQAAPHMRRVTMTISDSDHYAEQWVKTENGKHTVFTLNFVRRR
jgi:hypothetical protein